jgi:shikimate dehydrogenase
VASRGQARLFGVLGDPVDHSLSPAMQNAAFAAAGLPHLYLRFHVPVGRLAEALDEARRLRVRGLNLTVPLKEAAVRLVDRASDAARRAGSVNTIVFEADGRTVGHDTDGAGFLRALRGRVRIRGARVVLVGAGGSARAVGAALVGAGAARIAIANRTAARADVLAERLAALGRTTITTTSLAALTRGDVLADAAVVVNATPLGLSGARLPLRVEASPRGCLFVDLVYGTTPFVVAAARAGRPALDGARMLLHQGALAFEAWTGRHAPRGAMARALERAGLVLTEHVAATTVRTRRPPIR